MGGNLSEKSIATPHGLKRPWRIIIGDLAARLFIRTAPCEERERFFNASYRKRDRVNVTVKRSLLGAQCDRVRHSIVRPTYQIFRKERRRRTARREPNRPSRSRRTVSRPTPDESYVSSTRERPTIGRGRKRCGLAARRRPQPSEKRQLLAEA